MSSEENGPEGFVELVRQIFCTDQFIPLHAPRFSAQDKLLVCDAIDSTFVSSVGAYVDKFENQLDR